MKPSISFIIPAYNEEGHLSETVKETVSALQLFAGDFEVIIVNDGSSDRTPQIADALVKENPRIKSVHHRSNQGFGVACASGIAVATKEFIGWVSADTVWPQETLKAAIESLGQADIITTYPLNTKDRTFLRRSLSKCFTFLMNTLFGLHLRYFNGGCFHKTVHLKSITIRSRGLTFWAESLVRLLKKGLTVKEIGMNNKERTTGESKAFRWKNIAATGEMITILLKDIYLNGRQNQRNV